MTTTIGKSFCEFVIGICFAVVSYIPIAAFSFLLESLGFDFGRTTVVMLALVVGYPIAGVLGIMLTDKVLYKAKGWNIIGGLISLLLGFASGFLGIFMLYEFGGYSLIFMPFVTVVLSLLGYNYFLIWGKK
jgi:hypothetical protein